MPAIAAPTEQRVLLSNISWATYERILAEHDDSPGTRLAYDEGMLEIMTVYIGHEGPNRTLALLVEIVAEETGVRCYDAGSTTFKREDLEKGFEPDSCFYFAEALRVVGKRELDMAVDPPPELIIEVDITRSSLNRFRIFAAMGVAEIWRYDGDRVSVYRLERGAYHETPASIVLPMLTAVRLTEFVEARGQEDPLQWKPRVRQWVRSQL